MKSSLLFLSWIVYLELYLKRHENSQGHHRFSPMLSSKSFVVLYFTFRSKVHFDLILVKDVVCLSVFILHVDAQLVQHHLLKKIPLLHCIICTVYLCKMSIFMWVCFWAIFFPNDLCFYQYHKMLITVAFIVSGQVR